MSRGGGRRLTSVALLYTEEFEPMLEVERFLLWPLLWPPTLDIVLVRGLGAGRTLSVLI